MDKGINEALRIAAQRLHEVVPEIYGFAVVLVHAESGVCGHVTSTGLTAARAVEVLEAAGDEQRLQVLRRN